jgi:glycerol-3-phosphate dehydrogenase (NAD(P)+)
VTAAAVSVIGGGAWGTALAVHLARDGHSVRLWIREPELVERMRAHRDNPLYLPGVSVPTGVRPEQDLGAAIEGTDWVISVVPAQHARGILRRVAEIGLGGRAIVVASKGIEEHSLALPLDVVAQELGSGQPRAVLSGPSFAEEVAHGKPAVLVVASLDRSVREAAQAALSTPTLRVYAGDDPGGVQLAGALKNVIAIAAGVADSLGMGSNAQAALITRGLAEIGRLGAAMGFSKATFAGLAGLGDLVLTCTGDLSRNRGFGRRVGRGEGTEEILASTRAVVEGVPTTRAARELAARHGVEMPIVEELHRILFEGGAAAESLTRLMTRPLTSEDRSDTIEA